MDMDQFSENPDYLTELAEMMPSSNQQAVGQQLNYQMGRYADWGNFNPVNPAQMGQEYQSGQAGQQLQQGQMGQVNQPMGAHELMEAHEVLTDHIDGINQFELYRPHVKDQKLMQILDNQLNHMYTSYQNMVSYLQAKGAGQAVPYRAPKPSNINYGLRQPAHVEPNSTMAQMDDRDVASGMLGCAKSSALLCTTAALECADHKLRNMMMDCAVSASNQAYEIFQYMNQKGMYQVPTLAQQTTETMMNLYQPGTVPGF